MAYKSIDYRILKKKKNHEINIVDALLKGGKVAYESIDCRVLKKKKNHEINIVDALLKGSLYKPLCGGVKVNTVESNPRE